MRFLLVLAGLLLAACNDSSSSSSSPPAAVTGPQTPAPPVARQGLPEGVPPAARGIEPALPVNPAWPFSGSAPRTLGSGRYAGGAYYWTDFIYDANGALGPNPPAYRVGTPSGGSYHYPDEAMAGNGADIFRVGIGRDDTSLHLRVDWQTLLDPAVPIAAFALDYKEGGQDSLPGIPRITAPGVDALVFLSSAGVTVDRLDGNGPIAFGQITTDLASRSFVAQIGSTLFSYERPWKVYLLSGIHDRNGGFLDDNIAFRKLPTQPPVFNVAFRDYDDEPVANNFWFDQEQAIALNSGDISEFVLELDWNRMGETEPEPLPKGYSNRWYVSSLSGTALKAEGQEAGIDRSENPVTQPQYYDAVQPYGIYVPENYQESENEPTLFTWLLHSLTQNHNQYGATVPNFLDAACERLRQSICVTTLGRGPAGFYSGPAEVDLWEVWRDVAAHYTIDPERVISSGYSMGAIGTINLMIKYPDVFAGGVVLAGSHADSPILPCSPGTSGCAEPKGPELMQNLKWNGYYHAHGSFDQLVPFVDARATVDAMKGNGYRYVFDHYVAEDHIIWTLKDAAYSAFEEAAKWMVGWLAETDTRKQNPGDFIYRWEPSAVDPTLGIGPQGGWWLSDIAAVADVDFAEIRLDSGALSERVVTVNFEGNQFLPPNDMTLSPALREEQRWEGDTLETVGGTLTVGLENVAALTLDLERAGIASRADREIQLDSTHPVTLTLTGLEPGAQLMAGSKTGTEESGRVTLNLPAGAGQVISFSAL